MHGLYKHIDLVEMYNSSKKEDEDETRKKSSTANDKTPLDNYISIVEDGATIRNQTGNETVTTTDVIITIHL